MEALIVLECVIETKPPDESTSHYQSAMVFTIHLSSSVAVQHCFLVFGLRW